MTKKAAMAITLLRMPPVNCSTMPKVKVPTTVEILSMTS